MNPFQKTYLLTNANLARLFVDIERATAVQDRAQAVANLLAALAADLMVDAGHDQAEAFLLRLISRIAKDKLMAARPAGQA